MSQSVQCPIWGTPAQEIDASKYREKVKYLSPRAGGEFWITKSALSTSVIRDPMLKIQITDWIIEQHRLGDTAPTINSEMIKTIQERPRLSLSAKQRHDHLLIYVEESVEMLGGGIKYSGIVDDEHRRRQLELFAHTSSTVQSELWFLVDQAVVAGLLEKRSGTGTIHLTLEGYNYVASLRAMHREGKQAFVAMWFNEQLVSVYSQAIEPAVREAGYNALRIDRKEHSNKIDDEIVAEIRRSRFLIADFTSEKDKPRGGVYFEAGLAFGLGMPVIWTCRKDLIGDVHFDTRQYNHITWDEPAEFKDRLRNRIVAVVGPGPLLKPS